MRNLRLLLAWLPLLLLPCLAFAQERGTVTGTVADDATGQPLAGVHVSIVGTSLGAITNQQGRFLILNVPAGERAVRAAVIGYTLGMARVTVLPRETVSVDLSLGLSAVELEAIVVTTVTGQAQRRRELGTNTGHIAVPDINPAQVTRFADVLVGRTAGLTLQQSSGTTGMGQRIRIRGANSLSLTNEPLIFIDGVRATNSTGAFGVGGQNPNRLNDLNANDIESIEVVKGPAAAALYGTAAANGVILITTKRGRAGVTRWTAYVESATLEDRNRYPENWVAYQIRAGFTGDEPLYTSAGLFNTNAYLPCRNVHAGAGLCRQDRVSSFSTLMDPRTRPFVKGDRQRYGLSARGGGDAVRFYLSMDAEEEHGVIEYNELSRVNVRANIDAQVRPDLDVSLNTALVRSNLRMNSNDNSVLSPLINGLLGGPAFIEGPDGQPHFRNWGWWHNQEELSHYVPRQDLDRFMMGIRAEYRPLPWLSTNVNVGVDLTARHDHNTVQAAGPLGYLAASWEAGWRQSTRLAGHIWTGNAAATATFNLRPDLVSTSTVAGAYDRAVSRSTMCYGVGISGGFHSCSAASSLFSVGESFSELITLGGMFQQRFAWHDRVFLSAAVRADDTSAFGTEADLAYYPSASLSWVVSEEPFFPQIEVLSNLRLRTAWGQSGLRPGFRQAHTLLGPVPVTMNARDVTGVVLSNQGNIRLKEERSSEIELGLDAGFFNDRLSLDFTRFVKTSKDALVARRLAGSLGLTSSVFENLSKVRNAGTELGVNATVLDQRNVRLSLRFTNSTLGNRIEELGEGIPPIIINRGEQRHEEGYSAGAFFQRPLTWTVPADGRPLTLADLEVGPEEVFMGHMMPRWNRSLGLDLTLFRVVNVSTLFEGRGGNHQLDTTTRFRDATGHARGDRGGRGVWDPNASYEQQAAFLGQFLGTRAGYIHKADFVKWRELAVTLMPPAAWTDRFPTLRGAALTLAGRNLKTWTDYPGLDPEINETGSSTNFTQGEFNTQPPVRYLVARLNFNF